MALEHVRRERLDEQNPGWQNDERHGPELRQSDSDINALVSDAYRAQGTASSCCGGTCSLDTKLFWDASCTYASGSSSSGALAALMSARGYPTPCSWHYGLISSNCRSVAEMGASHSGNHVFVGGYNGRSGEDPDLQVWVR